MEEALLGLGGGFVYSINIVIGAGFLSIPFAFLESGIVLSLFYLFILTLQNIYLTLMFLEILHKAKYLKAWKAQGVSYNLNFTQSLFSRRHEVIETEFPDITNTGQIDASDAFLLIFGRKFGFFFLFLMTLSFEGTMIAYVSIFASSFTSNIPLGNRDTCDIYANGLNSGCGVSYWVYVLIYGFFVIYLTFKGLKEQKGFQVTMCAMRFVIMSLIVGCCFVLLLRRKEIDSSGTLRADPSLARPENTGKTVPIIIFALLYQLQLPSIAALIADKAKNLVRIVYLVAAVSFFSYGALGIVAPFAIDGLESEVSLNFRNYSDGYDNKNFAEMLISFIIVLFPAFDVISSYPLCSIALVDNWKSVLYGKEEMSRVKDRVIKGLIAIVPVVIALFTYDLGKILDFVGIIPLFTFNVMVPIGYIPLRSLIDIPSPYNIGFYRKSLNILIALLNFILLVYSFVILLIE